jgi:hypothetical protein
MDGTADAELWRDGIAMIEHVLSDRPGDWQVVILGSQANDWGDEDYGPQRVRALLYA